MSSSLSGSDPGPCRVLFVNSSVSGGGAGKALLTMVRGFDPAQIQSHVVMPEDGVIGNRLREAGAKVYYNSLLAERFGRTAMPLPRFLRFPWLEKLANVVLFFKITWDLNRLARKLRTNLIYANHLIHFPVSATAGWLAGVSVVFHSREWLSSFPAKFCFTFFARRKSVKKVIAVSEVAAQAYRSTGKVQVVYDTIAGDDYATELKPLLREEYKISSDRFIVGFMGRVIERKGVPLLMRAFKEAKGQLTGALLAVVGGNDPSLRVDLLAKYKGEAQRLGIEDCVLFTGFKEDPRPYLLDFDVSVMPSLEPEPFGLVPMEGAFFGIPAIIPDNSGVSEVMKDGETALHFRAFSSDSLAAQLVKLAGDAFLRKKLGDASKALAFEQFDKSQSRFSHAILEVCQS